MNPIYTELQHVSICAQYSEYKVVMTSRVQVRNFKVRRLHYTVKNDPVKITIRNLKSEPEPTLEDDIATYRRKKLREFVAKLNTMPDPAANSVEVGNKFVCSICDKKLYTRVRLDRHYELVHNMVQCKKCGELIESNDVSIRIHNRKCITGFKD